MFVIYSKENCNKCNQAELLLGMKSLDFKVLKLNVDFTGEDVKELAPKQKEFPVVIKVTDQYEQYIGTLDDLKKHLKENNL